MGRKDGKREEKGGKTTLCRHHIVIFSVDKNGYI